MKKKYFTKLFIMFLIFNSNNICISSCMLNGNIEGKCISKESLQNEIKFCKDNLPSYICVPYFQYIWPTWTNKTIDEIVERETIKNIENEFIYETTKTMYKLPLINNIGCMKSYINLLCQKNFLPCNPDNDTTLILDKTVCLNFLKKCDTWKNFCDNFVLS